MAKHIDLPTARRYLAALTVLAGSSGPASASAREALRDMAMPGVSVTEYLAPMATLPVHQLTVNEQAVRLHLKGSL